MNKNRIDIYKTQTRLYSIDIARGIAVLSMIIFHFTWDLEFFGFVEAGFTATFGWENFARIIAASFLFIAGLSLILSHGFQIRIHSFIKRLILLILAATAISVTTFYTMPDAPIFFGILHAIAVASIIGLIARRFPVWFMITLALFIYLAPFYLRSHFFDSPWLWWIGLNINIPRSNDYVPLLPWFAPFLMGMAMAKSAKFRHFYKKRVISQTPPRNILTQGLNFIGRHSLACYLLHQPILLAILWMINNILP